MTSIAIFSTYPPSEGFGGPARTYHQRVEIERAGHDVTHVVVEANPSKTEHRPQDVFLLSERPFRGQMDHIYADVDLGRRAAADRRIVERVRRHLAEREVTLVILEQPFLVDLLEAAAPSGTTVLYSCQNVEYRLRRDLERFQFILDRPKNRADEVREIEAHAAERAAAVTTICETDRKKMLEDFGVESVLVPNGSTVAELASTTRRADSGVDFVFAGSSYWPNVGGFAQMATPSLAFLPPTVKIDVIGTAGDDILQTPSIARYHSINASRITRRGFLPMHELVDTMRSARAVIVPVFVGEGSNLKSADALACGAPVIMTERATHGYEDVLELDASGVHVVDSAAEFRTVMKQLVELPRVADEVGGRRRQLLSWQSRLQPLIGVIDRLTEAR
jgi:glycosyltransferase involved in cell wall biosynthesis